MSRQFIVFSERLGKTLIKQGFKLIDTQTKINKKTNKENIIYLFEDDKGGKKEE